MVFLPIHSFKIVLEIKKIYEFKSTFKVMNGFFFFFFPFPFASRRILKKVTMEPSERLANLQALWDSQTVAELGPCGENKFKGSNIKRLELQC